jgi:uncharacterized protein (DUF2252 family)
MDRGNAAMTPAERAAKGRATRAEVPRSSHADWQPAATGREPMALLDEQTASRVPELVPLRYARMAASPFAFYRGAAYVMAHDLAGSPQSGMWVQLCGDAHLSNFGTFASPDRALLFDLNDFDETLPGPWEWDVKRLAASIAVAGRERGFRRKQRRAMIRDAVGQYREAMRRFAGMGALDVWYARVDEGLVRKRFGPHASRRQRRQFDKTVAKAKSKDSARAFEKLAAHHANGGARIVADAPLVVPVQDLLPDAEASELEEGMRGLLASYRASVPADRRTLIDRHSYADMARKVVGVGSVGTRAWVILMLDRDTGEPLFLQAKEAQRSVLAPFAGDSEFDNQGRRVVEGQRLMQAASDVLLGWLRTTGIDGEERDFYIRQLWDWKGSADVEAMEPAAMAVYAKLCAWTLARAHARSGDAVAIAGYLGSGGVFDAALAEFSEAYADQNERDHRALVDAVKRDELGGAVATRR